MRDPQKREGRMSGGTFAAIVAAMDKTAAC